MTVFERVIKSPRYRFESQKAVKSYLFETVNHSVTVQTSQDIVADVQMNQIEVVLTIVVAHLFDGVAPQIQPLQRLGDEGIVEPLQVVVRHVEPLQPVLGRQQPVQLLQLVGVETKCLKMRKLTFNRLSTLEESDSNSKRKRKKTFWFSRVFCHV